MKAKVAWFIMLAAAASLLLIIPAYGLEMGGLTSSSVTSRDMTYYTITVQAGEGGSVFPNGVSRMKAGSSRFFTITPDAGFQVSDVKVNGISVGAVTGYRISNLSTDTTLEVFFEPLSSSSASSEQASVSSGEEGTPSESEEDPETDVNPKTGAC